MNQVNFRTLDLNLLRIFDEVMAERSLTRAAHKLALTQPAVSNAMRRLRERLGEDLMRRDGQGLRRLRRWCHCRQCPGGYFGRMHCAAAGGRGRRAFSGTTSTGA